MRPWESPRAFARFCVRVSVALAIAGIAGVVDRLFALPLAALVLLFAGLARLAEDDTLEPSTRPSPEPEPAAPVRPELPDLATVSRTFRMPASVGAERVWLVGEFNGWSRTAHPMRREGDWFTIDLQLVRGRSYRYRYLLDADRWENDWEADGYVRNEFGTDDSVARP